MVWNSHQWSNVFEAKAFAVCPFTVLHLSCSVALSRSVRRTWHRSIVVIMQFLRLLVARIFEVYPLWSICCHGISILYILLHQFAVRCCIFMAIWISMWSVISTLHDWFIWFYFAWFCFLLQVQREAEEISNGLGLDIYSYFNLDIRRFFPLIRVLLLFHHSMRCFLFDVVYNKVAFEVGMLWTIVIDFEKNMHGGMASQLKLLQITSGTVRLHFFLDLWHPCPCRDAAVTTMMITMKGTMDTAMATTKTLQWPGLWLWQPRWQPPWRWLLYSRLQWLWHALRFTMWHLVVNFQACFLCSSHSWSLLLLVGKLHSLIFFVHFSIQRIISDVPINESMSGRHWGDLDMAQ